MIALGKLVLFGANGLKIVLCLFWLECLQTAKFAETHLRARMNKMTDLERRALLGDRHAQEECTRQGIVLGCWRCGGDAEVKCVSTVGRPLYAVSCKKHYCGAYGCAHRTEKEAISYWNTRPTPPIGRCGECKHRGKDDQTVCNHPVTGLFDMLTPEDFCSYFEPKDGEEDAEI